MDNLFLIAELMLLAVGIYVGYRFRDKEMKSYDLRLTLSEKERKRKSEEGAKFWLEMNRLQRVVTDSQSAFAREFGQFWKTWGKCMKKVRNSDPERQDEVRKQIVAGIGGQLRNLEFRVAEAVAGGDKKPVPDGVSVVSITIS